MQKYQRIPEEVKQRAYLNSKEKVRVCSLCYGEKSIREFTLYSNRGKHLIRRVCKNCLYSTNKRRRKEDPTYRKNILISILKHKLKKKYGLPYSWYEETLRKQKGKCAICRSKKKGLSNRITFCVDHCHATGKVRGLLCDRCNKVLGLVYDDAKTLLRMRKYLRQHGN